MEEPQEPWAQQGAAQDCLACSKEWPRGCVRETLWGNWALNLQRRDDIPNKLKHKIQVWFKNHWAKFWEQLHQWLVCVSRECGTREARHSYLQALPLPGLLSQGLSVLQLPLPSPLGIPTGEPLSPSTSSPRSPSKQEPQKGLWWPQFWG